VRAFGDTPVLCGHRGSGRGLVGGHAENTLGSFHAAVRAGLRWVEVDARITADDVLVARHDPIVDDGRFVSELTAAQTDELGLMRVEALLEELPADVGVDVDVKTSLEDALRPPERTTAALVAALLGAAPARELLVSSFDPAALLIVRARAPEIPIGWLTWIRFPLRKAIAAAAQLGADVVAPHVASFPLRAESGPAGERDVATSLRVAHEAGLQVLAWCPQPEDAAALLAAGADCLVVDDAPGYARSLQSASSSSSQRGATRSSE
jgi:glycerophosphoryl diester phosphodiesterase